MNAQETTVIETPSGKDPQNMTTQATAVAETTAVETAVIEPIPTTAARPIPTTAARPTPAIVDNSFVIVERDEHRGVREVRGILADVPGFGRLARWSVPGPRGLLHGFARIYDDPMKPPEVLAVPTDEVAVAVRDFDLRQRDGRRRLQQLSAELEHEIERFTALYPHLAERLGIANARPARVFEVGICWRPVLNSPALCAIDWEGFRDRHAGGDFGSFGTLSDGIAELDSAVAQWTLPLQRPAIRNGAALAAGYGVVRSRFELPDGAFVSVATVLRGHDTFTEMAASFPPVAA